MRNDDNLLVAIIGAGLIELAVAAHLVKRKISFQLLEASSAVGENFLLWGDIRGLSPGQYNIDKEAAETVELNLLQMGACNSNLGDGEAGAVPCCGPGEVAVEAGTASGGGCGG